MKKVKRHICPHTSIPKKSKSRSVKSSTPKLPPKRTEFDEYREMFSMRMKPVSEHFMYLLAKDLTNWATHDKNALILKQFFLEKGVSTSDVHRWRKKNKLLDSAIEFAKGAIGARREVGALTRKFDANIVMKTMMNYCDEWKQAEVWRAELKQKQEEKTERNNIQWVLKKFPETNAVPEKLVPKKKDKDE